MFACFRSHKNLLRWFAVALMSICWISPTIAQSVDDELDPIKLFDRGQDAHARGEFEQAIQLYTEAIELRPEFPEAEYQRGSALVSLLRFEDAEKSLRRAIELRPEWALPFALLGDVMVRQKRYADSEPQLNSALKLEPRNSMALIAMAELRLQTKAPREVLSRLLVQLRDATAQKEAQAGIWLSRGLVERALGDTTAALASYDASLKLDSRRIATHIERFELLSSTGEVDAAIESALEAKRIDPGSVFVSTALARLYLQSRRCDDATRTLDELDVATRRPSETASLRTVIALECATGEKEISALEATLVKDPRNPEILARLCSLYRLEDPPRALDYCRRALEVQPQNVDYGTNYAAALVQARRFLDAVIVLRRVIAVAPDKFVAHSNLAIALYQLQRFPESLVEYNWIIAAKPETTAAYFFKAIIHDKLGEYEEALSAYQTFIDRADPQQFKLEIEKANLRLPSLTSQIKRGQGVKRKR